MNFLLQRIEATGFLLHLVVLFFRHFCATGGHLHLQAQPCSSHFLLAFGISPVHTTQTSLGQTSLGLTSLGLTSLGLTSLGLTSLGLTSLGLTSLGLTSLGLTSLGLTSLGLTSLGLAHVVSVHTGRLVWPRLVCVV